MDGRVGSPLHAGLAVGWMPANGLEQLTEMTRTFQVRNKNTYNSIIYFVLFYHKLSWMPSCR